MYACTDIPQKLVNGASSQGAKTNGEAATENKAFVLQEPNKFIFEDRSVPKLASPKDVLIQVNMTGICGSDVHYWAAGRIGSFVVEKPLILGHESSGTIIEAGTDVTTLRKGDRVAMEPGVPCRICSRCKEGKYNLCKEMAFAATPPFDGTLCRYYVLPEDLCYKLPEHVSLEEGALLEPLSVAVHLVRQSQLSFGQSIVVFGAGPVGLLCCAVAKAFGAEKIIAVDIQKSRLDFAKRFAATSTFEPAKSSTPEDNAGTIIHDNGLGDGVDIVIDASGAEPSIQTAIHVLRMGGTYVQGGMGKEVVAFPITAMCTKELNVRGSFRYAEGDYRIALNMVASGRVKVAELISSKVAFEDAEQAFEDVKAGKGIKILIEGPR